MLVQLARTLIPNVASPILRMEPPFTCRWLEFSEDARSLKVTLIPARNRYNAGRRFSPNHKHQAATSICK
jgi:hypothetical protein